MLRLGSQDFWDSLKPHCLSMGAQGFFPFEGKAERVLFSLASCSRPRRYTKSSGDGLSPMSLMQWLRAPASFMEVSGFGSSLT